MTWLTFGEMPSGSDIMEWARMKGAARQRRDRKSARWGDIVCMCCKLQMVELRCVGIREKKGNAYEKEERGREMRWWSYVGGRGGVFV